MDGDIRLLWDHKDEWRRRANDFTVTVTRHMVEPSSFDPSKGQHRWAVYAYIYPRHRLFEGFSGDSLWQPAALNLPLHGGPSLLKWHVGDDGKPASVQVGADYGHLHDERFSHYATADDAVEVFRDAQNLFDWLI